LRSIDRRPFDPERASAPVKRRGFALGMDVPLVSDNVDLVINAGFEVE
jgi:hypothetical protein